MNPGCPSKFAGEDALEIVECIASERRAGRRNLAVAVPFGEGPFTTRFADLRHRAVKVGGLLR
jgi:hypothetical protein